MTALWDAFGVFVGSKLYVVPALLDVFDVLWICFVGPKLSSVLWFGPRSKISYQCRWWYWWSAWYWLWLVLIDGFQHSFTLSHEIFDTSECITLVWCPSVWKSSRGISPFARTLIAGKVGPNEDISLNVGRRPLPSRWLRLLMLFSCCYWFWSTQFIVWHLSLSLPLYMLTNLSPSLWLLVILLCCVLHYYIYLWYRWRWLTVEK
jgi:hypothetical protein